MHPLPRMLQQRLIRLIARFANYMMNLRDGTLLVPVSENATAAVSDTELAKTVLGDIIVSQRQKTQEWNNMLQGLTNKLGTEWTGETCHFLGLFVFLLTNTAFVYSRHLKRSRGVVDFTASSPAGADG